MIEKRLYKGNKEDMSKYTETALWCIRNNAIIEDKGDYYEVIDIPEPTQEELEEINLQNSKEERADILEELKVEVDGMVFDADIDSQNRIGSKVVAYQNMGMSMDTKVKWVLADNTIADVTLSQLAEAHYRASQVTERIWLEPYNK